MRKKKKKQQKFVDFFFCLPNNLRQLLNIDKSMMLNLMFSLSIGSMHLVTEQPLGVKTWHWVTALPTLWTKRPNPSKVIATVKMSTVLLTKISLITRFTCQHYFGVIQSGLLRCLYGVVIYTSGSKVGWVFFSNTARLS